MAMAGSGRWLRAAVAGAAVLLVSAGTARAQPPQERCVAPPGARCGLVTVPLDRSGTTPGTVDIRYVRMPALAARRGTIVLVAGGPGEPAVAFARQLEQALLPFRHRFDLVVFDQRGVGLSAPLRCSAAPDGRFAAGPSATPADVAAAVARCGEELGARRAHFTTYETALDLEDLRAALGVERIIPLGVSYGGQVAGEYARRFPERTQALVLDSPSPIEGLDALARLPFLALPRVLREICFPPGCHGPLSDPVRQLGRLARRLTERPLRGRVVLPSGRRRAARLGAEDLLTVVLNADVDPLVRTELPAALTAARRGDAAPLLRLALRLARVDPGINEVRFAATACVEGRLPWSPASEPADRAALLERALDEGRERYAPMPAGLLVRLVTAALCRTWPATPRPPWPPDPHAGPEIPVLVLAGREDLRTPLEDARRTAAQFPRATVLAVPGVGHSVLFSDVTGCALLGLDAFLAGEPVHACRPLPRPLALAAPTPRTFGELPAGGRLPPRVARTARAVGLTLLDAFRQLVLPIGPRTGGLRGGRLELGRRAVRLVRYSFVAGVTLTGPIGFDGSGRFTVGGRRARGRVTLSPGGRMSGVIGDVPFTGRVPER